MNDTSGRTMAPEHAARKRHLPGDSVIAFAQVIVDSKPPELTYEEFIQLLLKHVARGRRENAMSAVHRHLDRSSYWRSEYDRIKEMLKSAENEKIDLQMELDCLRSRKDAGSSTGASRKRKKQDYDDALPSRSPKRTRQGGPNRPEVLTASNVDSDLDPAHLGEAGDVLTRNFYQAHAMLKSRERTDPVLLARHLIHAGNAACDVLQAIAKQRSISDENDVDALKSVLAAVSRSMQSLLLGYTRLSNVARGVEVCGSVVYAYVQILEKSTTIIGDCAEAQAKTNETASDRAARPSTSKGKGRQIVGPTSKQKKNPALGALSSFIAANIDQLDAKTESHKPLFEGLAYVLIEKLATCLYTLVFGRARATTIEQEIELTVRPDEIEEADRSPVEKSDELQVKAAKLEAPYLIQLLTRIMQVAPAHFGASSVTKSGKGKATSKNVPLKDNLAITAKERLQRTLMNCMFGTEGADEVDPFLECLSKPIPQSSLPAMPAVKETDVQEWFKEEVWRLLGWDILAREGGW